MDVLRQLQVSILFLALAMPCAALAADMVSAFKGSIELGAYNADFVKYFYAEVSGDALEIASVEGSISSRLYKKPEDKSSLEVLRSFERELVGAGFNLLAAVDRTHRIEIQARDVHGPQQNAFLQRRYTQAGKQVSSTQLARVATQAQQYLSARKTLQGTDVLVSITIGRDGNYVIDQVTSAAMETGTVALDPDALQQGMTNEGRMAIYGIRFETGSATIQPGSAPTLEVIAAFLETNADKRFYVVGHTDDTGAFDANMALSRARAESVVAALEAAVPGVGQRLRAAGVGPLSPVAINTGDDGRCLEPSGGTGGGLTVNAKHLFGG